MGSTSVVSMAFPSKPLALSVARLSRLSRCSVRPRIAAKQTPVNRNASTLLRPSSRHGGVPLQTWHRSFSTAVASSSEPNILCSVEPAPTGGDGTVATVTLSNPKRLNSLDSRMIGKLTRELQALAYKPSLRCVVLQGAPTTTRSPSFTSGADIFEMAKLNSYEEAEGFISQLHSACQAVRDLPVVTIARIDGLCLGGGLELAAACDFRYATHRSTFSMPETKYGIPSVIEARLLVNIIGWQRTKEMCYFARVYGSQEVERWGLVDQSLATVEELDDKVAGVVRSITGNGPKAMREQKRLITLWEENDLATGVEAGVDSFARMFSDGGSEPHHYMKEFTERKKAK